MGDMAEPWRSMRLERQEQVATFVGGFNEALDTVRHSLNRTEREYLNG